MADSSQKESECESSNKRTPTPSKPKPKKHLRTFVKTARFMHVARRMITRSNSEEEVAKENENGEEVEEVEDTKPSKIAMVVGLVLNIIPLGMIVLGAVNWNRCPLEFMIPIWMVVAGVIYLFSTAVDLLVCFKRADKRPVWASVFDWLFIFSMLAWLIAGSVWVYGSFKHLNSDASSPHFCDLPTYIISFSLITIAYMVLSVIVVCLICLTASAACLS